MIPDTPKTPAHTIYIAGPMRGKLDSNRKLFGQVADRLRIVGWTVINPIEIGSCLGPASFLAENPRVLNLIMEMELRAVELCDALFLLPDWQNSEGTRKELNIALSRNIPIYKDVDEKGVRYVC